MTINPATMRLNGLASPGDDNAEQDPFAPRPAAKGFSGFTDYQRQALAMAINAARASRPYTVSFTDPNSRPWPVPQYVAQHPEPQSSPMQPPQQYSPQSLGDALRRYGQPQRSPDDAGSPPSPFGIGGIFGPSLGGGGGPMAGLYLGADPVVAAYGMGSL